MDADIRDRINEQIRQEFHAGYLYLAMSGHFEAENLEGFGHWMRLQAKEELGHAMRLYDYVLERGERVELRAIDAPPAEFGSPVSIFEQALEHERKVTGLINQLYALATERNDYPTQLHLHWFIDEQVEEEQSAERAVEQLRMAGDNNAALLMLDRQFGQRSGAD